MFFFWGSLGAVWGSRIVQVINLVFEPAGHPVTICIIGDPDAAVAQLVGYVPDVVATEQPDGCIGVAQVVDPDPLEPGAVKTPVQCVLVGFSIDDIAFSIGKDIFR